MAAKTPDSVERVVMGNKALNILTFASTNLDNGDTVDLSPYSTSVDGVWYNESTSGGATPIKMTLSGTGNTTVTAANQAGNLSNSEGKLFVLGTP